MAIQLTERVKLIIQRFNQGLSENSENKVKQNSNQFLSDIDNIMKTFVIQGITVGKNLECNRQNGQQITPDIEKNSINNCITEIKSGSQYRAIDRLYSNYNKALLQNEIILDEIKQQDKAHLREQFRLTVFRVLTAIGIASALVFMGLLANKLGVQIGLPLFKII